MGYTNQTIRNRQKIYRANAEKVVPESFMWFVCGIFVLFFFLLVLNTSSRTKNNISKTQYLNKCAHQFSQPESLQVQKQCLEQWENLVETP